MKVFYFWQYNQKYIFYNNNRYGEHVPYRVILEQNFYLFFFVFVLICTMKHSDINKE